MARTAVGLISGTSMDGIDVVAADFTHWPPQVVAARTISFSRQLETRLAALRANPDQLTVEELASLDVTLGDAFAGAARTVITESGLRPDQIQVIGSHGQTVLHRPESHPAHSLQIGDPSRIAAATGILTVADFRRADLAAGGQGAPLAPLLHAKLFADEQENRAVVNLGGIANVSLLPAGPGRVTGFDTGPANCLADAWYRRHHPDRHDTGGRWAAQGKGQARLLEQLLADPFFTRTPPKSTGIEYFSSAWLDERLDTDVSFDPADVQATLIEFTARTVFDGITDLAGFEPRRVIASGGGVHNDFLMGRLKSAFGTVPVESSSVHGVDPDHMEALLFAWLAVRRVAGEKIDTRSVTGAACPVRLGAIYAP